MTALLATLISACFLPTTVWAYCTVVDNDGNSDITINIPARTINVSPSLGVGEELHKEEFSTLGLIVKCDAPARFSSWTGAFSDKNDTVANAYNTGVPGVGIIFEITKGDLLGFFPFEESFNRHNTLISEIRYTLVKTGPIHSGEISGAGPTLIVPGNAKVFDIVVGTQTVQANACDVTQTLIPVNMPSAHRSHFSGIGSRTDTVPFNIPLYCYPGTNVKFQIDATADSSGLPGVMRITPGRNSAKGVGIELRQDSKFVKFGVETSATGYQPGEYRDVPFTARYIQTEEEVEGGQANGTATFTMTYN
ncbi:fimbrial protein [Pseudomonas alkylphenolica]|nr:fimbrial protein [Pseudomonas alkylphenolica]